MTRRRSPRALGLALGLFSCTDPVRDAGIAALGGEEEGVPPGPDHRPGQPCLLCHAPGGPASGQPFAVAGTVFRSEAFDSTFAQGIVVQFVDANGSAPRIVVRTNASGNFFVREKDWPDVAFPLKVGLYGDLARPPIQTMQSLVGRDGSCGACHRPNRNPKVPATDDDVWAGMRSVGQIYVVAGEGK